MLGKPRVLLLDIETAPHRVYAWGLWGQNIALNQIEEPGYTICWAAKWLGEPKMMFSSIHSAGRKAMLRKVYGLLGEADIVVHYNGRKFDIPTLNQEFLQEGWGPPAPYHQVDLYEAVRRRFRLASNKLDYVAKVLGIARKVEHKGMSLWRGCMKGDARAWRIMERYNRRDVKILEEVYNAMRAWVPNHPNFALYTEGPNVPTCPSCGSTALQRRGFYTARTRKYQKFHCNECGAWSRVRVAERTEGRRIVAPIDA